MLLHMHDWTQKNYPEPQKRQEQLVLIPRHWFGEGIGNDTHSLEVTVLGTVTVSGEPKDRGHANVHDNVEYGTVVYKDIPIDVVAPIPGLHGNWRYIGYPQALIDRMQAQERKRYER